MAGVLGKKSLNADSSRLPVISQSMVHNFLYKSSATKVAETKANRYSQKTVETDIISCICVKRQNNECVVKSSVFLKNDSQKKFRSVVLTIDEEKQTIQDLRCISCVYGVCVHALAFLKYLQHSSEERAQNRLCDFSNKVALFDIEIITPKKMASEKKNLLNKDLKNQLLATKDRRLTEIKNNRNFTTGINAVKNTQKNIKGNEDIRDYFCVSKSQAVKSTSKKNTKGSKDIRDYFCFSKDNKNKESQAESKNFDLIIKPYSKISNRENIQNKHRIIPNSKEEHLELTVFLKRKLMDLSLKKIFLQCSSSGIRIAEGFLAFAKDKMDKRLCELAEHETKNQSANPLWYKLHYGRITASKVYETSRCRTTNGNLVQEILCIKNIKKNKYMKRAKHLEDEIFKEILKLGYKIRKCGFFLRADFPYLGASPNGMGKDFILEIKCPFFENTFQNYLEGGKITKKCKAQVLLQMLMTGKKKGLFCVADCNFEYNKKIYIDWVEYDENELNTLIEKVFIFWKNNIYPQL